MNTMTPQELQNELAQFTGTEFWYRHPLNPRLLYTEGVEYFAEHAKAYWFLDLIAVGANGHRPPVPYKVPNKNDFGIVLLTSTDKEGHVEIYLDSEEGGTYSKDKRLFRERQRLFRERLGFTDCSKGVWKFFLIDDGEHTVLLLPSEY